MFSSGHDVDLITSAGGVDGTADSAELSAKDWTFEIKM